MIGVRRFAGRGRWLAIWLAASVVCGCSGGHGTTRVAREARAPVVVPEPASPAGPEGAAGVPPAADGSPAGPVEVFPGVRVDIRDRLVEFDGRIPIDAHQPETPDVYIEVLVCSPDSKEHESLVMTGVRASHVHAALLLVGLKPGAPGSWSWSGDRLISTPPAGDPVAVFFVTRGDDGREVEAPAASWVVRRSTGEPLADAAGGPFVFAGSRIVTRQGGEWYDADGTGLIVGLTTFGSESIAWAEVLSHDSAVQEPDWIANRGLVPRVWTEVTVRIRPARPVSGAALP